MIIIGETLNASIKTVKDAIVNRNISIIATLAREQVQSGADMLDVNAGSGTGDEYEDLKWLIHTVQEAVNVPLVIDSSNPDILVAVFDECKQRPMLNSISGEPHKLEVLLPFLKGHDCSILGLCISEAAIPNNVEETFKVAKMLIEKTANVGLKPADLYIDPGVISVATESNSVRKVIETTQKIKKYYPKVNIATAVSNGSFGLPSRRLLNRTFSSMLICAGVDALIMDVRDKSATATVLAAKALFGMDDYCVKFIRAFRQGILD